MALLQIQLSEMVEKMPAFPTSVSKVIELASDIDCNHKDLVEVVEHDPVMTLKILKLVNSAYFGLSKEITSINHSVVYVGLNTVKNLALTIASIGVLPRETAAGLNMDEFLYHSLSTAALARFISKQMGVSEKEASDFFVTGLLHDFGKIIFAQFMSEKFKKVLFMEEWESKHIVDAEKEVIGADHTEVGVLLGEKWRLPSRLLDGISSHHSTKIKDNDDEDGGNNKLLIDAIFIANKLSKELEGNDKLKTFSDELMEDATSRFGNDLNKHIASPNDLKEEVKSTLQVMQL